MPCSEDVVRNVVLLTTASMVLLIILPMLAYGVVKLRAARARQQKLTDACVGQAIDTLRRMDCPAVYIRGDLFCKLGSLRPHGELRDAGMLTYKDRLEELSSVEHFSVFLSHQWLANSHPDPNGVQYPVMMAAVRKLAESLVDGTFANSRFLVHSEPGSAVDSAAPKDDEDRLQRMLSHIFVWVDYISIPQVQCELQNLAIHTLSSYCAASAAFIVIAPMATQQDTGQHCNFTSYQTRMWTRAEQFCHAAVNGIDSMWIATSEKAIDKMGSHKLLAMGDRWLLEMLHVFDGEASDDMDKIAMAIPMLGVYAELYACADDLESENPGSSHFLSRMFELIREYKHEIFPDAIKLSARGDQAQRPRGLHGNPSLHTQLLLHDARGMRAGTVVYLFRDLVPALERRLDRDDALRNELRTKGLERRGMAVEAAKKLTKLSRKTTGLFAERSRKTTGQFAERSRKTTGLFAERSHKTTGVLSERSLGWVGERSTYWRVKGWRKTTVASAYPVEV